MTFVFCVGGSKGFWTKAKSECCVKIVYTYTTYCNHIKEKENKGRILQKEEKEKYSKSFLNMPILSHEELNPTLACTYYTCTNDQAISFLMKLYTPSFGTYWNHD